MEALFDLIFGNLAFLIVIIGGVISFLKRANEGQRQNQNRKQTQTPSQKQYQPSKDKKIKPFIPQLEDLFGEITKHLEEQNQKHQPTVTQAETRKSEIENNREVKEVVPNIEKTKPLFEHVNKNTPAPRDAHQTIEIDIKDIDRKKVIEGVIWGEILGPPRARKKHSYSYLKRG